MTFFEGYVLEIQEVNIESLGRIPTGLSLRGIKMQTIFEIKDESDKDGNQAESQIAHEQFKHMPGPEATPMLPAPLPAHFAVDPTFQDSQNSTLDMDPMRIATKGD